METHQLFVKSLSGTKEKIVLDWLPANPAAPSAIFIHGLASDRQGEKALHFQQEFAKNGWSFLKFDLRGHGESGGKISDMTVSGALADLETVLRWHRQQRSEQASPPLMIGSSMGAALAGWYQAQKRIESGGPLALLAPALDFPHCLKNELTPSQCQHWQETGFLQLPSDWADIRLGWQLIEDANLYPFTDLLKKWRSPALLIHGMEDDTVTWKDSTRFLQECPETLLQLLLFKAGDHRLSTQKEQIFNTIWQWLKQLPASS